jgi:outer membrane protein, multidrug efflux system
MKTALTHLRHAVDRAFDLQRLADSGRSAGLSAGLSGLPTAFSNRLLATEGRDHRFAISLFLVVGLLGIGLATGCKVGPDYKRPEVHAPGDWRWKTAEPSDHVPRGAWWTIFGDPSLNALQEQAVAGNLELRAAVARVDQARAAARISRSDFFPMVNGQAGFARYRTSGNSPSPVGFPIPSFTQQDWTVPFDLSYELDLWGRVRRSFESAQQLALSSVAAQQSVLLTLQADVAANYFSLQSAQRQIALLKNTIELRREALQIFEQRLGAGMGTEFEVERGKVEVASAEADLQIMERRRAELINALALLLGKAPSEIEPVVTEMPVKLPIVAPDLPSSLLERRPDVAQAERELASRMAQVGVAKAAFFPAIYLTARGGFLSGEVSDLFLWDSRVWSIGPSIAMPIFMGGRNKAGLERAQATYEEGVSLYRQRVLVAFKEVEDNLSALQFLAREAEARQRAAQAARNSARLSLQRYTAGAVNFLEVVDSENVRLLNELAEVRISNEQLLGTVRLVKALGGGWQ